MKELIYNKTISKGEIKNLVNWFIKNYGAIRATKLMDNLKTLGFNYATESGISLSINDLQIPSTKEILLENAEKEIEKFETNLKKGKKDEIQLYDKYIDIWNRTNEIMKDEILNNLRQTNLLNPVYMIIVSGARGNILQIKQLIGLRGLMVDSQGDIINTAIKNNLKEGLTIIEYFISCYGARKGLIDTSLKTANTGYLTRKLVYACQNQVIIQSNCKTRKLDVVIIRKKKKNYYRNTIKKLIGRTLGKNVNINNKYIAMKGQDICHYIAKKIMKKDNIYIKSPLTCKLNNGLCQICYGWDLSHNRIVELGENVGIIAAQSIGEPGTQLTMRTFHTGGIFSSESAQTVLSKYQGKIFYNMKEGIKIIKTKYKEKLFLTLKEKRLIIAKNKRLKSIISLPKYSLIFLKNNRNVLSKQIIAEVTNWKQIKGEIKTKNTKTKNIKTKISGKVFIENLKGNKKEKEDNKKLWIINLNILNNNKIRNNLIINKTYKLQTKRYSKYQISDIKILKDLWKIKSKINFHTNRLNKLKIFNMKNKIQRKNSIKNLSFSIINNNKKQNQIILNKCKTSKQIKVEKKFKPGSFILKSARIGKNNINQYSAQILENNNELIKIIKSNPNLLPTNFTNPLKNGTYIKKGNTILNLKHIDQKASDIVQGLPKIEEIFETKKTTQYNKSPLQLKLEKIHRDIKKVYNSKIAIRKSIYKIQKYIVNKIQSIYISQNISISNKHIEVVAKQMTSKCIIRNAGDSNFIKGEIIELNKLERINKKLKNKIKYIPIIIGISKLTKTNNSFITAACFQETSKILTNAAIVGKVDWLYGLKENIVIGNIIPSGTGYKK